MGDNEIQDLNLVTHDGTVICSLQVDRHKKLLCPFEFSTDQRTPESQNWVDLVISLYSLCAVNNDGDDLKLGFCTGQVSQAILAKIQSSSPYLASVRKDWVSLQMIFSVICNGFEDWSEEDQEGDTSSLNGVYARASALMNSRTVNDQMITWNDDQAKTYENTPSLKCSLFLNFVTRLQASMVEIFNRGSYLMKGVEAAKHLLGDINRLKGFKQDLEADMGSKLECQAWLTHCTKLKKFAFDNLGKWLQVLDGDVLVNLSCCLDLLLKENPDWAWISELYNNTPTNPQRNSVNFMCRYPSGATNIGTWELFETIVEDLGQVGRFLKDYSPSTIQQARDKYPAIKAVIVQIKKDYQDISNKEVVFTVGGLRGLADDAKKVKDQVLKFVLDGQEPSEEEIGISVKQLKDLCAKINDCLDAAETEKRHQEDKDRTQSRELLKATPVVKLLPLNGLESWLEYKKQYDLIIPQVVSVLTKKALILESLRNESDKKQCQILPFKEIESYLYKKYENSSLIPLVVDKMLGMQEVSNPTDSLVNLQKLINYIDTFTYFGALAVLDRDKRRKLVPKLLAPSFRTEFYRTQVMYEREIITKTTLKSIEEVSAKEQTQIINDSKNEKKFQDKWIYEMKMTMDIVRNCSMMNDAESKKKRNHNYKYSTNVGASYFTQGSPGGKSLCAICSLEHFDGGKPTQYLAKCKKFMHSDVQTRYNLVKKVNYCVKCLKNKNFNHENGKCHISIKNNYHCKNCGPEAGASHHTLLCRRNSGAAHNIRHNFKPNKNTRGRRPGFANKNNNARTFNTNANSSGGAAGSNSRNSQQEKEASNDIVVFKKQITPKKWGYSDFVTLIFTCVGILHTNILGKIIPVIALSDTGSTSSYCCKIFAKNQGLNPVNIWKGSVATLAGVQNMVTDVFRIPIIDCFNKIHQIHFLGTDNIGDKMKIPTKMFSDILKKFGLGTKDVVNPCGPIVLLLGLNQAKFLAKPLLPSCSLLPCIEIYASELFYEPFITGSISSKNRGNQETFQCFQTQNICSFTKINCNQLAQCTFFSKLKKSDQLSMLFSLLLSNIKNFLFSFSCRKPLIQGGTSEDHNFYKENGTKNKTSLFKALLLGKHCQENRTSNYKVTSWDTLHEGGDVLGTLACQKCIKQIRNCKACQLLSGDISYDQVLEMQNIAAHISVENKDDDKKQLVFDFCMKKEDLWENFSVIHSNYRTAKIQTEKLIDRLQRKNFLSCFNDQVQEYRSRGVIEIFENFSKDLSPVYFMLKNFTLKESKTTPVRIVGNMSYPNFSKESLNSCLAIGVDAITSSRAVFSAFRLFAYAHQSDLKKCYNSVKISEVSSQLTCFWWPSDISKPKDLTVWHYKRLNFGIGSASSVIECCLRGYVASSCSTPRGEEVVSNHRIVDDILSSERTKSKVLEVQKDIRAALNKYNFEIKETFMSGQEIEPQNVLGMSWFPPQDELKLNVTLNLGNKNRGAYVESNLSLEQIHGCRLTRLHTARIIGQMYSPNLCIIAPALSTLKILNSKIVEQVKDWKSPIENYSSELVVQFKKVLSQLVNFNELVHPAPRMFIPENHDFFRFIMCSDAGDYAVGNTCHIQSLSEEGIVFTNLASTKQKISKISTPTGELMGICQSLLFLIEILTYNCFKTLLKKKKTTTVLVTDSMSALSSLNTSKKLACIKQRNLVMSFHRLANEITISFPCMKIVVTHLQSSKISADFLTKPQDNVIESCNSPVFRQGPECYQDITWPLPERSFIVVENGKPPMYNHAVAEQHSIEVKNGQKPAEQENSLPEEDSVPSSLSFLGKSLHNSIVEHNVHKCYLCSKIKNYSHSAFSPVKRKQPEEQGKSKFSNVVLQVFLVQTRSQTKKLERGQQFQKKVKKAKLSPPASNKTDITPDHGAELPLCKEECPLPNLKPESSSSQECSHESLGLGNMPILESRDLLQNRDNKFVLDIKESSDIFKEVHVIEKELYLKLINLRNNLFKVVEILQNLFKFKKHFLKLEASDRTLLSYLVLVKSSQKHFPPEQIKSILTVQDCWGISRAVNRLSSHDPSYLVDFRNFPPIISHTDKQLCFLFFSLAHEGLGPVNTLHLPYFLTCQRMGGGSLPVRITRFRSVIKGLLEKCVTCRLITAKTVKQSLTEPRILRLISKNTLIFKSIYLDLIGPWLYSPFPKARQKVKLWCLQIVCGLTRAINFVPVQDQSMYKTILALKIHCLQYGFPDTITVDHGTNFYFDFASEAWRGNFKNFRPEIIRLATSHQFLNLSEMSSKIVAKFFRIIFRDRLRKNFASYDITQITYYFELFKKVLNARPLFHDDTFSYCISPDHLINTYKYVCQNILDQLTLFNSLNDSLYKLYRASGLAFEQYSAFLNNIILGNLQINKEIQKPGDKMIDQDIVLIKRTAHFFLGKIEKAGPSYSWVLSSEFSKYQATTLIVNNSHLILLYRNIWDNKDAKCEILQKYGQELQKTDKIL